MASGVGPITHVSVASSKDKMGRLLEAFEQGVVKESPTLTGNEVYEMNDPWSIVVSPAVWKALVASSNDGKNRAANHLIPADPSEYGLSDMGLQQLCVLLLRQLGGSIVLMDTELRDVKNVIIDVQRNIERGTITITVPED